MKKTVLEKDNKYNKKKTKNLKVLGVATIYTLALSIGLSVAAFALFNKLKNIELPTETPIESVTPTETTIPTEQPTETITPTETPIESSIPIETSTPTISEEEILLGRRYNHNVDLYGKPIIVEVKVDNEKKIIITNLFSDQFSNARFFVDYFSQVPLFMMGNTQKGEDQFFAIGAYKGRNVEVIDFSTMNDYGVLRIAKKYGFDITNYPKVKDLLEWYKKNIPEKERIPLMQFLDDITGWDNIRQWNEDYTGPYLENSNTDYIKNVTFSASSKESVNNKLIASGLLKQDSNTNIVEYQKILQKRA